MKRNPWWIISGFLVFAAVAGASLFAGENGKELYLGQKYHCFSCHGVHGEGGDGPAFKGIGKKYDQQTLLKRAAHNCPPTGACNPKELHALVEYIRTM